MQSPIGTILVVAPYFPPKSGGLERYASEISRLLAGEHGWRVAVLTTSEDSTDHVETREGMTLYRLAYRFKVSNTPFSFSWLFAVPRIMRTVRPDVVHVHLPVPGLCDIAAYHAPRGALAVTYHAGSMRKGSLVPDVLVWLYEHGPLRFLLRKATRIMCSSDWIRDGFLADFREKTTTVMPAVDGDFFSPDSEKRTQAPRLLCVGGLAKGEGHKGTARLVSLFIRLLQDMPELTLELVGEGDATELRTLLERSGCRGSVVFSGRLTGQAMADAYRRAHLFVLPTLNDSFPMVVLEAMASGLPVVTTRVGYLPSVVEDGVTGFLVSPDDDAALEERVRMLLFDGAKMQAFGKAGRERVREGYAWRERAGRVHELLTALRLRRPTIVHVSAYYPPHVGGMEVVARELAEETARRGYLVHVLSTARGAHREAHVERRENLMVRRLAGPEFAHTPLPLTLLPRLLLLPRRSVLHVHIAQALVPELALIAAGVRGFPLVAHFHLDVEPSGAFGFLFLLYKRFILGPVLRRADRVIVFSDLQAQFVQERYRLQKERVSVLPNGVSEEYFMDARTPPSPGAPFRLLFVGRLTVQKRVDRLIDAFACLSVPALLTIVGDGEDRRMLEERARALPVSDRILFAGAATPERVRDFYREADVFVLPSDREGMPLCVLEAMAAGLPIVASDVMGIRELVAGVGVLVAPLPEAFAAALSCLAGDIPERMRMAEASRAHARAHAWPFIVDRLLSFYSAPWER